MKDEEQQQDGRYARLPIFPVSEPVIMKKSELLDLYEKGERNFSGVDLRLPKRKRGDKIYVDIVLANKNLSEINLSNANLTEICLEWVKMNGANMSKANLFHADMARCDLENADLQWADLRGADLRWANLNGANLSGANLSGADLRNAQLNDVDNTGTIFEGTDMRKAMMPGIKYLSWNENPLKDVDLEKWIMHEDGMKTTAVR